MRIHDFSILQELVAAHLRHGLPIDFSLERVRMLKALATSPASEWSKISRGIDARQRRSNEDITASLQAVVEAGTSHSISPDGGLCQVRIDTELLAVPSMLRQNLCPRQATEIFIRSGGGDINVAFEILDNAAIWENTSVIIEEAFSSAAVLAVAAPCRRLIVEGGTLGFHPVARCCLGSPKELRRVADECEASTKAAVERLQSRTGPCRLI